MTRVLVATLVPLCVLGLAACPTPAPCSAGDTVMFAHGAECAVRVRECGSDALCKSAIRADCNEWGDRRCGFAGAAGAP